MESEDLFQDGVDYSGEVICYSESAPEAVTAEENEEEEVQDDDDEEENEDLEELENIDDDDEQDPNEDQDQDMVTDKNDDQEKPSTSNILCGNQKEINMSAEKIGDDKNSTKNDKEKTSEKLTKLPLSKIKNIIKLDPDLKLISSEALFAVTKATELFIDSLAKESFLFTRQAKKKIIQKRDVDLAISSVDSLMFLDGAMN